MSITIRTWSDEELKKIATGQDKWLATVFMNVKSFGEREIKAYPYHLRKTYTVFFAEQDEPVTIFATDDKNLIKFLKAEYDFSKVEKAREIITEHRDVKLRKRHLT